MFDNVRILCVAFDNMMNIPIQLQMDGTVVHNSLENILNKQRIVFYRKSNFCRILIDKILKSLVFILEKIGSD